MKRSSISLAIIACIALIFSGCASTVGITATSRPPAAATTAPAAVTASPENTAPASTPAGAPAPLSGIVYTSKALGIAFNVPLTWVNISRVEEGDGWLTLYFSPQEPIDPDEGDGELFSIVRKTPDVDETCYDNSETVDINGVAYIWGEPTDVRYQQSQPSYDVYAKMLKALPSVRDSVRAATGNEPGYDKYLALPTKTYVTPKTNVFSSRQLRITFTVPESWVGKYRVEESADYISVYFVPKEPLTDDSGDGWLFCIEVKTSYTANDAEFLDGAREFTINGVDYICGGPTDVSYQGPEQDTFGKMNGDIPGVYDSIKAID